MNTIENAGITYSLPVVVLLQESGLGVAAMAAHTAYDSFNKSEHRIVQLMNDEPFTGNQLVQNRRLEELNTIEGANLLDDLAWTYFHHSVLEHSILQYLIKDIPRGVLQELVHHRIMSPTVKSTRYTMSSLINAFVAERLNNTNTYPTPWFFDIVHSLDLFVTTDKEYNDLQIFDIFNKLRYQYKQLGSLEFLELAIAKSALPIVEGKMSSDDRYLMLEEGKKKRNVGDAFKMIVNDSWKTELVLTINLRSLKNLLELRLSGAAYFQIRWLAEEIVRATPKKYLDLIIKPDKLNKILGK